MSLLHGLGRGELRVCAARVPGAVLGTRHLPPGHGTLQLRATVDGPRLLHRYDGDFTLSTLLSTGVRKKRSCCYCANKNLKHKIGMNHEYCGIALHELVSNWLSVAKDKKCVFSVARIFFAWWCDIENSSPARGQMPPGMHWRQVWISPELLSTCQAHVVRESTVLRENGKIHFKKVQTQWLMSKKALSKKNL